MDGIEIRLSHNHGWPRPRSGGRPPVVLRGFVSRVSRHQSVDGDGRPMRVVSVEGQDYGKIWQMLQILRRPWFGLGEAWLSSFPLFERFGIGLETNMPASELVEQVVRRVLNEHLRGMLPPDWTMPTEIRTECLVDEGLTSVTGPQNAEGSVWQILSLFGDVQSGFCELYVEDREEGVFAVYRPSPALGLDGLPIQEPLRAPAVPPGGVAAARNAPPPPSQTTVPNTIPASGSMTVVVTAAAPGSPASPPGARTAAVAPSMLTLPAEDIVALDLARSDENVANYFWVEDSRFELVRPFPLQFMAATGAQRETVFMENHPNNNPAIYGLRPMVTATQLGDSGTFATGQPAAAQTAREQEAVRWLDRRRRILALTNRDNAVLESGTARIAGNETIRPGIHVILGRGPLAAPYYVVAVQHDYIPFEGFFTTLTLERGQGFARRIQANGPPGPYLIELGASAVVPPPPTPTSPELGQAGPGGGSAGAPPNSTSAGPAGSPR